jgi:hypothetical protein
MNIFVCVKQVPDTETKITPTSDGSFIETASIKWIMNPYDDAFEPEVRWQPRPKVRFSLDEWN